CNTGAIFTETLSATVQAQKNPHDAGFGLRQVQRGGSAISASNSSSDGLSGRLSTWPASLSACASKPHCRSSRQALSSASRASSAGSARYAAASGSPDGHVL